MFNLGITLFNLRYIYTTAKFLDVFIKLWSNTKWQVKKQGNMKRDKLASLKLKLYLFSSADAEQQRYQWQMPVKEKKYGTLPGPLTYASIIMTPPLRHEYQSYRVLQASWSGQTVIQAEGWRRGWGHHPVPDKKTRTKRFTRTWRSPREDDCPKEGESLESAQGRAYNALRNHAKKHQWHAKQACPRTTREDGAKNPTKNQSGITWWNGIQVTPRMRQARVTDIPREIEDQWRLMILKCSIWDNRWEASEIENWRCRTMHLLKIKIPQTDAQGEGWWTTAWF